MESLILQMIFSLSVVLVIMAGITFVVKRSMGISTPSQQSPVKIEILAHKALQPKRAMYVVRVANSVFVVGSSEQGLQMFTELNDDELLQSLKEQQPAESNTGRIVVNAHNLLSRLTGSTFSQSGNRTP